MYKRTLYPPNHSFFLFGPRATGKTTWLKQHFDRALWFNLLLDEDYLPLLGDTRRFRERVESLEPLSWVVVDEIQRLPNLLNEVHDLLTRHQSRFKFALSGSSARKLRRLDVDLLAGRLIERSFFPLTAREMEDDFDLDSVLSFGSLPTIMESAEYRVDKLRSYVSTYLHQEIQQEALVKDLGSFHRFLRVAALMHGQVINASSIARDAAVAYTTVQRYFDTLVGTLIGTYLPGWQARAKVREYAKPKFYFFDAGLVRALTDTADERLLEAERGPLLEGYILHELRSALAYQGLGGELSYWGTIGSKEIDFVWSKQKRHIGIEVKASSSWRPEFASTLNEFITAGHLTKGIVVYRGKERFKSGHVEGFPVADFLDRLYGGFFKR